jgi:hypothetical protein
VRDRPDPWTECIEVRNKILFSACVRNDTTAGALSGRSTSYTLSPSHSPAKSSEALAGFSFVQFINCSIACSPPRKIRAAVMSRGTPVARLSFSRIDLLSRQPSRQGDPVRVSLLCRAALPCAFGSGSRAGDFGG